ncbi:unnamed protein product [Lathyrus oleraceus]
MGFQRTKIITLTMIFLYIFFIIASEMSLKSEGRELDWQPKCQFDGDCRKWCDKYKEYGRCVNNLCWCSYVPPSGDSSPFAYSSPGLSS